MVNYDAFSWVETSPLVWQRDADEAETFWSTVTMFHDSKGRKPFEITGHVSINVPLNASSSQEATDVINTSLATAWQKIRYDHPTIASSIKYDADSKRFYKEYHGIRDPGDLQHWLESTLVHITNHQTGADFANSDPIAPQTPTLFVIHGPISTSMDGMFNVRLDLVLRASHNTIDGTGTILLFGNLLRHVSDILEQGAAYHLPLLDGSEAANLSPPYRVAAGIPSTPTPAIQTRIERMFSEHVQFGSAADANHSPSLALPFKRSSLVADRSQRVEIIMKGDVVVKILTACKNIGATITHILHAAIPIAIRDLNEKGSEARSCEFVHDLLYNLRAFCLEPYNTSAHPVTIYQSGGTRGSRLPVTVPAVTDKPLSANERKEEFSSILSRVRDYYIYVRNDASQGQLAPYFWQGHLSKLPKIPDNPSPGPPPLAAPSVSISSLGKVDNIIPQQIGQIKVSDPWVMGDEMSNAYGLFLVTHGSRMSLSCAYNAAWHDGEDALDFLQRCKTLVFEFLEIAM